MDPGTIIAVVEASDKVLSLIAKYYTDVKNAKTDIEDLKTEVGACYNVLQKILVHSSNATKLSSLTALAPAIKGSLSDIENIKNKLDPSTGKKAMSRVGLRALKWPFTKKEVQEHIARLDRHKTTLNLALSSDQTSLILDIDDNISQLQQSQNLAEQDRQLGKLLIADGAAFDSYHRQHEPQCVKNTRVDLLRQVQTWNTDSDKCIFWLNGMAGTGKSTIARTVACVFADQKHLRASFFFSRGAGDLGHATKFVSTLAFQLASLSPLFKQHLSQAIADHDHVTRQGLRNQWKELILKPLSMLNRSNLALTLVIDALDECECEEDIKLILQLFVEAKELNTAKLKIFLTSRPEMPIRLGFQHMPEVFHQDLILHDVPRSIVEYDISIFLKHELDRIRNDRGLPGDWCDEKSINILVQRSDCLFIYIATACRFIRDPNWRPQERLFLILESNATGHQLTAELDSMYTQILELSLINVSSQKDKYRLSARFRHIVGSIVTLFDVLSIIALAGLLNVSVDDVSLTLSSLHSVLNIPSLRENNLPIRLLHPSFRDFLVNNERCDNSCFFIDQELVHVELAKSCLQLLSHTLKRNICNLRNQSTLVNELQCSKVEEHLSKDVQYACRHWVDHLERVDHESRIEIGLHDDGQIQIFLLKHILHWLEALSLMGKISEGVHMITRLERMLQPNEHPALKTTIYDAKRFILSNKSIIEEAPLQLYDSALVFCPYQSVIKAFHSHELPTWITRYPEVEEYWSPSLQVLEGHTYWVTAVNFSSDDQLLASASCDNTIRLWNPATGTLRSTLEGHTDWIITVIFSRNDQLLASASEDQTIRLWDPATGTLRSTLDKHTDRITAIAFSGNSQLLASASWDRTVQLWDPSRGKLQSVLRGHTEGVMAVAFSVDDQILASASRDRTIRLWNPTTGMLLTTLQGHKGGVTAVAFSGDGHLLASASWDQTIQLWDLATRSLQSVLIGHASTITAVAFSGDGRFLASGSHDQTIRLWDVATQTLWCTLEGHTEEVAAVTFSGDSRLLASASWDQTIRLWDPSTGALQSLFTGHTGRVMAVAFSGNDQLLASTSRDRTIRLWNPASIEPTGRPSSTRKGHTKGVTAVAFSGDGHLVASASWDGTIQLWDPATGMLQNTLIGHVSNITAIAFSGDGQLLASASHDQTIRLWDTAAGMLRSTLEGHSAEVAGVAFSSDGQLLASSSLDRSIRLWDPATGTLRSLLEGHTDGVAAVDFSSDGQLLASVSWDGTVRLWNAVTGALRSTLEGHTDCVIAVAFSSDGQRLASASEDQTIRLWNPTTGNLVQKFEAKGVKELSFSSDQTQLKTDIGLIQLSIDADDTCGQSLQSGTWMIQRNWLTWNGQRALWLPPDFRPGCSAIRGNQVVIGHRSGRVIFLGLQSGFNQ